MYRIAYATGSRADYGIVQNYLRLLDLNSSIALDVLVTGAHLSEKYGNSINIIETDGFNIAYKADLHLEKYNRSVTTCMAIALDSFGKYFEKESYDLLIILGDRYEMLAVAIAAAMNKIPILHLHGGEVTYGNYDEFIRHSITKMSTYHFTSTSKYRNRVIQLGESPDRVFNLGALGVDNCLTITNERVEKWAMRLPSKKYFIVAFHPETLTMVDVKAQTRELIAAIDKFREEYEFVIMGPNADTNSDYIRNLLMEYSNKSNVLFIENVNVDTYLYLLKESIAIIGNSSSGIIEAPSLKVYTINIGDRQRGRDRAKSVIDVECRRESIIRGIETVLINDQGEGVFENPYFNKNALQAYYQKTLEILSRPKIMKEFYDLQ